MRNGDTTAKQTQLICGGKIWLMIVFWARSSVLKKEKWTSEALDYDTCFAKHISRGLLSNWEKSFLVADSQFICSSSNILFVSKIYIVQYFGSTRKICLLKKRIGL